MDTNPNDKFQVDPIKHQENEMREKMFEEADMICSYTRDQAIADGVLVPLPTLVSPRKGVPDLPVCITTNMLEEFRDSDGHIKTDELNAVLREGLRMLNQPDEEDSDSMRLRVIKKATYWVILNGEGITYFKPEDY